MDLAGPSLPKLGPGCVQCCAHSGSGRLCRRALCFPHLASPETCTGFCLPLHRASQLHFVQCFVCVLLPTIIYVSVKLSGNVVPIFLARYCHMVRFSLRKYQDAFEFF